MTEPLAGADADQHWLLEAIGLSRRSAPSATAYSVGAVLVAGSGRVLSTGYSRETEPADHAEEVAIAKLGWSADRHRADELAAATLYSSLEPCAIRASRPVACADLIIASGIGRVVYAWHE
ncbi:MAG: dCMP deaminase, partial [Actinobacteria bacterium]|nr:dCMP deaminase [Actinomycetota bacterium]